MKEAGKGCEANEVIFFKMEEIILMSLIEWEGEERKVGERKRGTETIADQMSQLPSLS